MCYEAKMIVMEMSNVLGCHNLNDVEYSDVKILHEKQMHPNAAAIMMYAVQQGYHHEQQQVLLE
jgi:altronate dehydratase